MPRLPATPKPMRCTLPLFTYTAVTPNIPLTTLLCLLHRNSTQCVTSPCTSSCQRAPPTAWSPQKTPCCPHASSPNQTRFEQRSYKWNLPNILFSLFLTWTNEHSLPHLTPTLTCAGKNRRQSDTWGRFHSECRALYSTLRRTFCHDHPILHPQSSEWLIDSSCWDQPRMAVSGSWVAMVWSVYS